MNRKMHFWFTISAFCLLGTIVFSPLRERSERQCKNDKGIMNCSSRMPEYRIMNHEEVRYKYEGDES